MLTADNVRVWPHTLVWVLETDAKGQPIQSKMVQAGSVPDGAKCYAHRDSVIAAANDAQAEFWRNFKPATLATES